MLAFLLLDYLWTLSLLEKCRPLLSLLFQTLLRELCRLLVLLLISRFRFRSNPSSRHSALLAFFLLDSLYKFLQLTDPLSNLMINLINFLLEHADLHIALPFYLLGVRGGVPAIKRLHFRIEYYRFDLVSLNTVYRHCALVAVGRALLYASAVFTGWKTALGVVLGWEVF